MLSPAQSHALEHVRRRAEAAGVAAREAGAGRLARSGLPESSFHELLLRCRDTARITLNFHPDRLIAGGSTVARGLLADGHYRSQFVTGISNGSRTAFAGGERDRWEESLFGGAYHHTSSSAEERPKYGGLDLMVHADGACPRFGSCYFELHPHMASRCTFTWGDSHLRPESVGTIDTFEPVLAALIESVASTGEALGRSGLDVGALAADLEALARMPRREAVTRSPGRALDAYIEAQIHGPIDLARDVAALVVDPAFEGSPTGEDLSRLAAKHGFAIFAHRGFVLAPSEVPDDFRGPRMVPLAARLDERFGHARGELDAAVIGRAARALHHDPGSWSDWGTTDEALQHLKQLWHVLVQFGRARPSSRPDPGA